MKPLGLALAAAFVVALAAAGVVVLLLFSGSPVAPCCAPWGNASLGFPSPYSFPP